MKLAQAPDLAIFLGHQRLFHCGEFHIQVAVGKVEIRRKSLGHISLFVILQGERARLVFPSDPVEIEQAREDALARVRELRVSPAGTLRQPGEGARETDLVSQLGALYGLARHQPIIGELLEVHRLENQLHGLRDVQAPRVDDQVITLGSFAGAAEA